MNIWQRASIIEGVVIIGLIAFIAYMWFSGNGAKKKLKESLKQNELIRDSLYDAREDLTDTLAYLREEFILLSKEIQEADEANKIKEDSLIQVARIWYSRYEKTKTTVRKLPPVGDPRRIAILDSLARSFTDVKDITLP